MSQLQKEMEEYLAVRRALGFKLRDAGRALHNFVAFMDQAQAPVITTKLTLQWARATGWCPACPLGKAAGYGAPLCSVSKRHRPADGNPAPGIITLPLLPETTLHL